MPVAEDSPGTPTSPPVVPAAWNSGPLGGQAKALSKAYARLGSVHRLKPRLVTQDDVLPLVLPASLLDPSIETCVTVTALTAPNIAFLFVFSQADEDPARPAWPIPSAAGAAEVTRCGARKSLLRGLGIKLRSRRGVAEFLVLESESPPPPISEILTSRNPGPSLPSPQVGRRPWLPPLKDRISFIRETRSAEGAESIHESALTSNASGRGSSVIHLTPGCHRLELLADAHPEAPPDLDGRLFALAQGIEIASDEEHRAQVSLRHCVGSAERLRLDYSGAVPHSEVVLVQSIWSIPDAFPISWGSLARARLAQVAWQAGLQDFAGPPVFSSLGVRGTTRLTLPTDPAGCYIANLAPIRGDVTNVALGARAGAATSEAHASDGAGVSLAFCAQGVETVFLEAQTLGAGGAFILGVWRSGRLE